MAAQQRPAQVILNGRTLNGCWPSNRSWQLRDYPDCATFGVTGFAAVRRAFFAHRRSHDILINNAVTMAPKAFKVLARGLRSHLQERGYGGVRSGARRAQPS
jgi:hypothetical protein